MRKVIARLMGGLGNQLFGYAAARRLALVNDAELVVDHVTGFARDRLYNRRYALDRFHIPARKATRAERMEPFDRGRRVLARWVNRHKPFCERSYLDQEGRDFDERLLRVRFEGTLRLDGFWQSEGYFKDVETIVRQDLRFVEPLDAANQAMAAEIRACNAVALHVRWFDEPNSSKANTANGFKTYNASVDYYLRAIALLESKLHPVRYFVFSDDPASARAKLGLTQSTATLVAHNRGDAAAYADLWLMSQCRHFIIANSTFSWWGAWLAARNDKVVVAPDLQLDDMAAWGFQGLLPADWITVSA
jgi:hypothetical protein